MPAFEYVALDGTGKREKGIISSDTARAARKELRLRQLTPVKLSETKQAAENTSGLFRKSALSESDLLLVTRQLAMLIQTGTPVEQAIAATASQAEKPGARKIMSSIRTSVTEGYRLSEAMGEHSKTFPELYRSIVSAGEASGELGNVLERLAEYLERARKVRQTILAALIYPIVLGVVALLVVIGLMTFVVPRVVEQFETMEQDLPALTSAVIAVSDFMRGPGILLAVLAIPGIWVLSRLTRQNRIKRRTDAFLLGLPIVGNMLVQMNAARFARTLSTLMGNGAPVLESLTAARGSLTNEVFRDGVKDVITRVREGSGISRAMKATGVFPPLMVQLASGGEASGQLPEMLQKSAEYLEDEFESSTSVALGLLEPAIILFLGGIVALIVLSIMLPILRLNAFVIG